MIISTEDNLIVLKEVFTGITLKTSAGEIMHICMRDSGFEFNYQGNMYFAKEGYLEPFNTSIRENELVEQKHIKSLNNVGATNHGLTHQKAFR